MHESSSDFEKLQLISNWTASQGDHLRTSKIYFINAIVMSNLFQFLTGPVIDASIKMKKVLSFIEIFGRLSIVWWIFYKFFHFLGWNA